MIRRSPILMLAGMAVAIGIAIMLIMYYLNPPAEDLGLLVQFMSVTGGSTILLAYFFHRAGWLRWFPSLRWALLAIVVITVFLVLLNVWVTARLMFISEHDFVLTSALLIFAGTVAVIFGMFVSSGFTTRISDLSKAAERLAQGKLDTRLQVQGNDELSDFAQTFNWMAGSLQKLDAQKREIEEARRDLIAWVSHDLRTPLTSIRAMLEAMADGMVTDEATATRYIRRSLDEVENLNALINDLFELAKLDTGHFEANFVQTSLSDLISDVASSMSAQAETRQITLKGDIAPDIDPVVIAPDKIQRVLRNLIDNALRYTPSGGIITLKAYPHKEDVAVDVHNTGPSISPEHLPFIFNSFYRGEKSRARTEDGHRGAGLGLAIARGFVEAHGGKILVESTAETGTRFCFIIPRKPRPSVIKLAHVTQLS